MGRYSAAHRLIACPLPWASNAGLDSLAASVRQPVRLSMSSWPVAGPSSLLMEMAAFPASPLRSDVAFPQRETGLRTTCCPGALRASDGGASPDPNRSP